MREARPKQWLKNVLVFAAPAAAGSLFDPGALLACLWAFLAFCVSASGVYFVNDILDVEADRAHPRKRSRPIASGIVPVPLAWVVAVVLFAAGLAIALVAGWQLLVVVLVYDAVQLAYCLALKHVALLDIAVVSSGFLLRAIAGGVAAGVVLSQWFLIVAVFGSLLMVTAKRYAELLENPEVEGAVRGSLRTYTPGYLRFVWQTAAAILILGYSLWAFGIGGAGSLWLSISVAPFVLAVLRYCQHADRGDAEEPEEVALGDRILQALAVVWILTLVVGVYVAPALA